MTQRQSSRSPLELKIARARSVLTARVREIIGDLRAGTTICPGMLSSRALVAAGFRLPAQTNRLALMRPILDELRETGELRYLQGGKLVARRRTKLRGPFRVAGPLRPGRARAKPVAGATQRARRFNYDLDFDSVDFRKQPELYRVGVGEQGVLLVEPYKSEILPHWRFRSPEIALRSARTIFKLFKAYLAADDFVGMDMARKFLQMGFTRARRYANHQSGRKFEVGTGRKLPQSAGARSGEKAEAARIFYEYYVRARDNPTYAKARKEHQRRFG